MNTNDCSTCHGVGSIWQDDADSVGDHGTIEAPCPECTSDGVPEPIHDGWEGHDTVAVRPLSMTDLVFGGVS